MSTHVGNTCRSGFYHLRQLRLIRRHLTEETAATLIHAFVLTSIEYCNDVLVETTKQQQNRLQMVLNTAARLLLRIPKFEHIPSAIINTLHLLPVPDRLTFKIYLTFAFRSPSPSSSDHLTFASPSRLEQCCGCWSNLSTGTLHLVVGGFGTSSSFLDQFAPGGALLPLRHNTATCLRGHRAGILELNSTATSSVV